MHIDKTSNINYNKNDSYSFFKNNIKELSKIVTVNDNVDVSLLEKNNLYTSITQNSLINLNNQSATLENINFDIDSLVNSVFLDEFIVK